MAAARTCGFRAWRMSLRRWENGAGVVGVGVGRGLGGGWGVEGWGSPSIPLLPPGVAIVLMEATSKITNFWRETKSDWKGADFGPRPGFSLVHQG